MGANLTGASRRARILESDTAGPELNIELCE